MPPVIHNSRRNQAGNLSVVAVVALLLLLATPAFALGRLAAWVDWRWLVGLALAISIFTFFTYRTDKRRAVAGEWRIPESTLHVSALLGGWPGAFLAQRIFRHKVSKVSFQFVFWMVVLIHEFVAVDFLLDWRFARQAIQFIKSQTA